MIPYKGPFREDDMTQYGTLAISGASGSSYKFTVHSWDTKFNPIGAVYVITKRTEKPGGVGSHTYIYVGQTGDLSERFDDHHKINCFRRNGANCICVHPDANKASHLKKEEDLIQALNPPCNG
jgi:hypothetical protein